MQQRGYLRGRHVIGEFTGEPRIVRCQRRPGAALSECRGQEAVGTKPREDRVAFRRLSLRQAPPSECLGCQGRGVASL